MITKRFLRIVALRGQILAPPGRICLAAELGHGCRARRVEVGREPVSGHELIGGTAVYSKAISPRLVGDLAKVCREWHS
jgi:hypothetical protein